jgi:hypothetical protein
MDLYERVRSGGTTGVEGEAIDSTYKIGIFGAFLKGFRKPAKKPHLGRSPASAARAGITHMGRVKRHKRVTRGTENFAEGPDHLEENP